MSQCTVPKWNLRHQRQEQVEEEEEESNRSSHVHSHSQHLHNSTAQIVPMSNYEVAELTWENGQIAMHELGGLFPPRQASTKPATWGRTNETLESIVHQAARHKQNANSNNQLRHEKQTHQPMIACDNNATVDGKMVPETFVCHQTKMGPLLMKKRNRSESNQRVRSFNGSSREEHMDLSTCGSASATFCRDSDTTMMTWASFDSPPPSFKSKTAADHEDSASHGGSENQDEDRDTKTETVKSQCSRRTRAAAVHNQSERRRRDRINQKMKALQKLVPNASKTDKASMLDEVIEYLKQLQAQVQVMSTRQMPQMMMPLGMQQQLQMSLLARMGMGVMGMGMYDINSVAPGAPPPLLHPSPALAAPPAFVPSPFMVPSVIPTQRNPPTPQANQDQGVNSSVPLPDPYRSFLHQSINMDLYNKMAALYWQQVNQPTQATANQPLVQGDRSTCSSKVNKE